MTYKPSMAKAILRKNKILGTIKGKINESVATIRGDMKVAMVSKVNIFFNESCVLIGINYIFVEYTW